MTAAEPSVVVNHPKPGSPLDSIGRRIDAAWKRAHNGEQEWVEGSLELMQALREARQRFPSHNKFGRWLDTYDHNHISHQDRAALIGMASDLKLAREVLSEGNPRAYRYIWEEVKGRFTQMGKTEIPKPSQRRRGRSAQLPPEHNTAASKFLDEAKTRAETAAETGLSEKIVQLSAERELGRREILATIDAAAAQALTEKGKLKVDDAIRIYKARLDKSFEHAVATEVRRQIDAANDFVRQDNIRLAEENLALTRIIGQYAVFTLEQYRQMLKLCHPDNPASPETRATLLDLLVKNRRTLVKPD
jgi:hypothetical protein